MPKIEEVIMKSIKTSPLIHLKKQNSKNFTNKQ